MAIKFFAFFFPTISTFGCFWSQWPTSLAVTSGREGVRTTSFKPWRPHRGSCRRATAIEENNGSRREQWLTSLTVWTVHSHSIYDTVRAVAVAKRREYVFKLRAATKQRLHDLTKVLHWSWHWKASTGSVNKQQMVSSPFAAHEDVSWFQISINSTNDNQNMFQAGTADTFKTNVICFIYIWICAYDIYIYTYIYIYITIIIIIYIYIYIVCTIILVDWMCVCLNLKHQAGIHRERAVKHFIRTVTSNHPSPKPSEI